MTPTHRHTQSPKQAGSVVWLVDTGVLVVVVVVVVLVAAPSPQRVWYMSPAYWLGGSFEQLHPPGVDTPSGALMHVVLATGSSKYSLTPKLLTVQTQWHI